MFVIDASTFHRVLSLSLSRLSFDETRWDPLSVIISSSDHNNQHEKERCGAITPFVFVSPLVVVVIVISRKFFRHFPPFFDGHPRAAG